MSYTVESIIARYAKDVAFVAEKKRAKTLTAFIEQLQTASFVLDHYARINGAEELETAATYLADAHASENAAEKQLLLKKATEYLNPLTDIVDEYRLMV